MQFHRSTNGSAGQRAKLRRLLRQIDAQWEELAYSIQQDRHTLLTAQKHWENIHLAFALDPEARIHESHAITTCLNTAEQEIREIKRTMLLKQEQLKELERQFDQARLAAAAHRETFSGQKARYLVIKHSLINALARPLRILWKIPHPSRKQHIRLVNDALLKSVRQPSKNREKEPSQSN